MDSNQSQGPDTGNVNVQAPKAPVSGTGPNQPTSTDDPLVGRVFNGRYRVTERVARGGMGKVYKAIQDPLDRIVALKVLDPTFTGEVEHDFHQRFFLEASICARLSHPNTVTIFDYGQTEDNIYYIVMEFLEGRTLHQEMKDRPVISPPRAIHIAAQVARSVREAHALGVVHRDLKPANIFLIEHPDEADFVKVLDFGLVKNVLEDQSGFTKTGIFMGSPGYMAPEQIRGHALDERADVYALGAILFEMLTGRPPFVRESAMDTILAHLNDDVPRFKSVNQSMEAPKVLEQVVRKCLAKDRNDRFDNMDGMVRALKMVARQTGMNLYLNSDSSANRSWSGNVPAPQPPPAPPPSISGPIPTDQAANHVSDGRTVALSGEDLVISSDASSDYLLEPEGKSGTKGLLLGALVAGAVIVMAVAAFWLTKPEPIAKPILTKQVETPAPAAKAQKKPAVKEIPADHDIEQDVPDTPAQLSLVLRSRPSGASVSLEGVEICEATPCRLSWEGKDAEPGRRLKLKFSLDGYKARFAEREIDGDELVVRPQLTKERVIRRPKKYRKPERSKPPVEDEPVRKPNMGNYKENPY